MNLGQEPALHTFRDLVHSEVYAVLLGHMSGMGFGTNNTLLYHGSEITQTSLLLKASLGYSPPWSNPKME